MHKKISTDKAPAAVGPYSQAIIAQGQQLIFISGQIPLNPKTMKIESADVREQTKMVLKNLSSILDAAGIDSRAVAKTTVFLKDMNDFATVNEEYEKFFSDHKPARACVEVSRLPKDALVEIEAIAVC
jgi:2-iminobutanoate/2-iminopropanoate deaminase